MTMSILEAITTRASVRHFTPVSVGEEALHTLLHAGFCAPSAHNLRPWHFVVIDEREKLNDIADYSTYGKMMGHAPCAIAVCGDTELQPNKELLIDDCAAAIQNILLAAHGIGLGAVWCGVVEETAWHGYLHEILMLPESMRVKGILAVGYPEKVHALAERYSVDKVHKNQW